MANEPPPEPPPARSPTATLALLKCVRTTKYCHLMQCVCCGRAMAHRLILTLVITFGIIICYTHRVCLSLAITEMTLAKQGNASKGGSKCPVPKDAGERPIIDPIQGGKHDWDEKTQSYLLMSFYAGYLVFNVPAGYLCDVHGAKWVITIGCLISSVCTALIPVAVMYTHWGVVVGLRVLTGLGQAPIYPGATQLMSKWIPDSERGLVGGLVLSSLSIGTILGNIPTAFILRKMESWVWVFYTYGIVGGVFCLTMGVFVYSTPETHPYITPEEKEYLDARITVTSKRYKLPFKAMLFDSVIWSSMISQFGNDYTLFTIISNFPKYMNDVLKFSSWDTGMLVCIPQVAMFICSFLFGAVTDALIYKAGFHVVSMRIFNTTIATILPCVCLLICCQLRCNQLGAVAIITLGMALKATFYSGMKLTPIDITKHHTGLVAAIINGAGGIAGVIAPYTIGMIAVENTFEQWDLISYISVTIAITTSIPYMLFVKAERRDWDYTEDDAQPAADPNAKTGCVKVFSCVNPH